MADWFERLFKAFISFRPARNWKCRYHNGIHYQDEISVTQEGDKRVSEWYLHGHLIASLKPINYPVYELHLTDAGYPTPTTLSRLNGILWLFKLIDIDLGVWFRLKYNSMPGYPEYTYIEYNELDYLTNSVNILFNVSEKRVIRVDIHGKAIMHFMKNPRLSFIRKLYYKLARLKSQLEDILDYMADSAKNIEPTQEMIDLANRIYGFKDVYYKAIEELGLPYGVYATHVEDAKDTLKGLIREGEELLAKARVILAELTLLKD
jgi:hypothetical protein